MAYILHIDDSPTVSAKVASELPGIEVKLIKKFVDLTQLKEKPVLAILDLNMPSFTGEQMSKFLMKNFGKIPIVIFSGENAERLRTAQKIIEAEYAISKHDPEAFQKLRVVAQRYY